MSCAQDLPQHMWTHILKHVPYKQRLSACALVCQKLTKAAAAATQSLALSLRGRPQRHDAFLSWNSSHGSSLTSLALSTTSSHNSIRELACPNLLQLNLAYCCVQLGATSEGVGVLHSCTALTHLSLWHPVLLDGMAGGAPPQIPSTVAQLHDFSLLYAQLPEQADKDGSQALRDRLFPHLTSLTSFSLSSDSASLQSCFLQHISTMVKLKELSVEGTEQTTGVTLPGIERLTALGHLSLSFCTLEPSCLSLTTGLTRLDMMHVTLSPQDTEQQGGELGSLQLLKVLARLPALRVLELRNIKGQWPQQLSAHSALTASSNLQSLVLYDCQMQTAAWAHVFPAGRQLPHLHMLNLLPGDDADDPGSGSAELAACDIARLASCCQALRHVRITICAGASLAPLQSLTALTSLEVWHVKHCAISSDLAALSQLQELCVSVTEPVGDARLWRQHLVPLTALTNLTALSCSLVGHIDEDEDDVDERDIGLSNKAPAGSPPDVRLQLLERCAADQAAQPAVISCMLRQLQQQQQQAAEQAAQLQQQEQQLAEQAAQLQQQEQQLAEQAVRLQQQEQQVAEQAARLQQQEQQLAAARAEAAAEAAGLHGQLQASKSRVQQQEQRLQDVEGQLCEVLAALRHQA